MANNDKLKKKIKKLERRLDQKSTLPKKVEKEIKGLKHKLGLQAQVIADLRRKLAEQQSSIPELVDASLLVEANEDKKMVIEHKNAWKRHTFLGKCYEAHLASGYDKDRARTMANQDLMDHYGNEVGFTAEQLGDILS